MKITKKQLRQIVKEELEVVLEESVLDTVKSALGFGGEEEANPEEMGTPVPPDKLKKRRDKLVQLISQIRLSANNGTYRGKSAKHLKSWKKYASQHGETDVIAFGAMKSEGTEDDPVFEVTENGSNSAAGDIIAHIDQSIQSEIYSNQQIPDFNYPAPVEADFNGEAEMIKRFGRSAENALKDMNSYLRKGEPLPMNEDILALIQVFTVPYIKRIGMLRRVFK